MLTINIWKPDTCDCIFHLAFDDGRDEAGNEVGPLGLATFVTQEEAEAIIEERRKNPARSNATTKDSQPNARFCEEHKHLFDHKGRYETVVNENQHKNRTLGLIKEKLPIEFKEIECKWSFDKDRKLNIEVDVPQEVKKELRSHLDKEVNLE